MHSDENASGDTPTILVYVGHTVLPGARSGVQRLVVEVCEALRGSCRVELVTWDRFEGQLRYLDAREVMEFSAQGNWPVNPASHRVNARFRDISTDDRSTWLLFPEIPYHLSDGIDIYDRTITQCHSLGIRVATVFYDLIPIREPGYSSARGVHHDFLMSLVRSDLILPISSWVSRDLTAYFRDLNCWNRQEFDWFERKLRPIPLAVAQPWIAARGDDGERGPLKRIVLLGTVEPRKQQTRFLKLFNDLVEQRPEVLAEWRVDVVGSLHSDSAAELHSELARNPAVSYHAYLSDDETRQLLLGAAFSAFPSRHEGYGLPIIESLALGVPCLTASFGAMAEAASAGGCHVVDVTSDMALSSAIDALVSDDSYLETLRTAARAASIRSWSDYSTELRCAMVEWDRANLERWCVRSSDGPELGWSRTDATTWNEDICWSLLDAPPMPHEWPSGPVAVCLGGDESSLAELSAEDMQCLSRADILAFESQRSAVAFALLVRKLDLRVTLTHRVLVAATEDGRRQAALSMIRMVSSAWLRASREAQNDNLLRQAAARLAQYRGGTRSPLSIVVSTFNRAPFVAENVAWLVELAALQSETVDIIVVDNCSTDNTKQLLSGFIDRGEITYVRNSANVGMLGNLRKCTSLFLGRHVWIVGDDDFILPDSLARLLALLSRDPGIAAVVQNFGVYHRESLRADDTAARLCQEMVQIAQAPAPTGAYRQWEVAAQHDNLYTAIYPLVLRSDIASAMFNRDFEGVPFGDLVQSVPTTLFFLEYMPFHVLQWISDEAIVGNAHNSWSRYRPRWHALLMSEVLQRAQESGVPPELVWEWMEVQWGLSEEAFELAVASRQLINWDADTDTWRVAYGFQRAFDVPQDVEWGRADGIEYWHPVSVGAFE